MFERFGSPRVIAAAAVSVLVMAATPAAAQGTPEPPPPPPGAPPPAGPSMGGSASGSMSTGLQLGGEATPPPGAAAMPPPDMGPPPMETKKDEWEAPLAGYNGAFYVRSKDDLLQMIFNGRMQFDFVKPFGMGLYNSGIYSQFILRRMRLEYSGCFGNFCFSLQPEYGPTAINGNAPNGTAPAGLTGAQSPAAVTKTIAAAALVNYAAAQEFQLMAGIVQTPFGLETRQSTKYKDFLEDGVATKFGQINPTELGLTVWGYTDKNMINYEVGVFNGDSGSRVNIDNRFDFIGRVFVKPLANQKSSAGIDKLQIGVSGRYGTRDSKKVTYDIPTISTANGTALTSATYTGGFPAGGPVTNGLTHIIPSGATSGFAAELRIPIENFDLTGEFFYISQKTREEYDQRLGQAVATATPQNVERYGDLSGIAYYAQASYWIGKRDIYGEPGFFRAGRLKFKKPETKPGDKKPGVDTAWRVRVRYDNVSAAYKGASDSGTVADRAVGAQRIPFADGDIKIHALQAGLDYFYTKHFGLRLNYGLYYTPDSGPATPEPNTIAPVATEANRASVPGNRLAATVNDDARRGAHSIHELILRAQVAF